MTSDQILRDPLTGAHSRATLQDRLREEVERARRYDLPLSLLILDLDHFKTVNDAFGHTRGDLVLTGFAERVRGAARDSDLLFRYGGDEFVLLLLHTDREQALAFATRLLESIRGLPFSGSPPLTLTLSIGSASFPEDGQTAEDLFERADRRLYHAKHHGRGRVVADDPPTPGRPTFETASRMMERELPLVKLRQFLEDLPAHKRGLFTISGPAGVGKSWFLSEVAKSARLRGYAVWSVVARPALRTRVFGALSEAQGPVDGLPPPAAGDHAFVRALQAALHDQAKAGLVLAVDNLADLDRASFDLLWRVLFAPELEVAALVQTIGPDSPNRTAPFEAPLQARVDLRPFTPLGVRLWLRAVLRWEAPEGVAGWLHRETGGLPRRLEQALTYLTDHEVLVAQPSGWTLTQPLDSLALAAELEALSRPAPYTLPTATTNLVGREAELATLKTRIATERLTTLLAPGGMGKTRLALQVAAELSPDFSDGVVFVPLGSITEEQDLLTSLAQALGVTLVGAANPRQHLLRNLMGRRLLLVLDNVEYRLPVAELLSEILHNASTVKLLVTSRERLNLLDESVVELRGLPLPPSPTGQRRLAVRPADDYAAEQLFVQSARRVMPDFTLADDDRLYIRRICELVEGLPLGIELAAAWTPLFTCREIAHQIERSLDFLASSSAEIPERQRSARAVLDYFWSLLADDERRRVSALAVFRGGFDLEAAQQTADASLFFLSALVDRAFLRKDTTGRYELQELLRQYAEAKLHERPVELETACDSHCRYFARRLAEQVILLKGSRQAEALTTITADLANVRLAWRWATGHGRAEAASQFIDGLVLFYDLQYWYHEGADIMARAAEAWRASCPPGSPARTPILAQLLSGQAVFLHRLGQYEQARRLLDEALTLTEELKVAESPSTAGVVLLRRGKVSLDLGDIAGARDWLERSLALFRAAADQYGQAEALDGLGAADAAAGAFGSASVRYAESLALRRLLDDRHGTLMALIQTGVLAIEVGDVAAAQAALDDAAALRAALGWHWATHAGSREFGALALVRGDIAAARHLFEEALAFHQDSGNVKEVAFDCLALAVAASAGDDHPGALAYYQRGLAIFSETGNRHGSALALVGLGQCVAQSAEAAAAARQHFVEAAQIALAIGALPAALAALEGLAEVAASDGQPALAAEALTCALYHPASSRATQDRAAPRLSLLEETLPAADVAAAEERGRRARLDDLIAALTA